MRLLIFIALLVSTLVLRADDDYNAVQAIFNKHCLDCHEAGEPDGNLVLESFETLMKGGESGAAIVAGKSAESLLVKYVEGSIEKDGKKKIMPPGKRKKLESADIAVIRAWIDKGGVAPTQVTARELVVPTIAPKVKPARRIVAVAVSPDQKIIAAARYGEIDLVDAQNGSLIRTLSGHRGSIKDLAFSADGSSLFAASGENAITGEAKQWKVSDGSLIRTFIGHNDILYAVAASPDGKLLATGSYDQKIKLWDVATGSERKTLSGHNGAVFDLDFRPDGKILASASGDRTVKLWNIEKGERVETFSQPQKDVYAVAFSRDGKKLYAGGVDNRIRVWQISETAVETTNPILESRYAHEGGILRLVISQDGKHLLSSADDRTVKLWDAASLRERLLLEKQPDWAAGVGFAGNSIVLGRFDGALSVHDFKGKSISTNLLAAPAIATAATRK